jgi:hypothetical protein
MEEQKGVQRSLQGATLVDLLDRILDKGLVVAGDIVIQLADVELLTIKIRLLVCSVDKAQEIGMDWWRHDTFLTSSSRSEGTRGAMPKLFDKSINEARDKQKKRESLTRLSRTGKKSIPVKTFGTVMREKKLNQKAKGRKK